MIDSGCEQSHSPTLVECVPSRDPGFGDIRCLVELHKIAGNDNAFSVGRGLIRCART